MAENKISISQALSIIAEAINSPEDAVHPTAQLEDLEGWDSMGVLLLMAELDERFSIILEEDTISAFNTVNDILSKLKAVNVLADDLN